MVDYRWPIGFNSYEDSVFSSPLMSKVPISLFTHFLS